METDYSKVPPSSEDIYEEEVVEEERVKLKTIAKGKVKKRGVIERLVISMIGPDGVRDIGKKLNEDIIMPAVKNIIVDSFTSGIQMAIFGRDDVQGYRNDSRSYNGPSGQYWGRPSTHKTVTNYQSPNTTRVQPRVKGNQIQDYILDNRNDAISILNTLKEQIHRYDAVSISEYNDLIGQDSSYTENQYGWRDLTGARIVPSRGGFVIKFPPFYEI